VIKNSPSGGAVLETCLRISVGSDVFGCKAGFKDYVDFVKGGGFEILNHDLVIDDEGQRGRLHPAHSACLTIN
jgi:hypothetical protein